mgnify:CR=1 FL=1
MNKTETLHPVELLLVVAVVALEAVAVLLVAAVGLLLTVARAIRRRAAHPAVVPQQPPAAAGSPARVVPAAPAPAPAVHPLAVLAEQLEADLTSRQLQALAGTRRKASKASLAAVLVAC